MNNGDRAFLACCAAVSVGCVAFFSMGFPHSLAVCGVVAIWCVVGALFALAALAPWERKR